MEFVLRNKVLVGSAHKASAMAIQEILTPNVIQHVPTRSTLWNTLRQASETVGLVILEDSVGGGRFGQVISRVRKEFGLPVVAVLSDATPKQMGDAILSGASGIVCGPILDVHGIMDAVNDALLAY